MAKAYPITKPAHSPTQPRWLAAVASFEKPLIWAIAAAGVMLVLVNTQWGAYLSDDSYYYVYPARDFAAGKGFSPSYIFAPLLPGILAVIGLFGVDPVVSIRWMNALLFGVNLLLAARLVGQITRAPGFPLLAAALLLVSDVVIEAHGWAMSEALAFTGMLASLSAALAYIEHHRRRDWALAAAFCALTVLTRYAALPLIPAVALALLLFGPATGEDARQRFFQRLRGAFLFGLVSLLPIVAYWLRNQMVSGHPVRYERFINVPLDRAQVEWFFYHWFSLFIPGRLLRGREILAGVVITLVIVLATAALYRAYRGKLPAANRPAARAGVGLCAAFLAFNLLMLYLARGLTQLDVFNARYLVPLLIVFLILIVSLVGLLWQAGGRAARWAGLALMSVFLFYYAYRAVDFTRTVTRTGLGYSNVGWHNSETVAYLREQPQLTEMVSTGEMGIYFWTGRKPRVLADFSTPARLKTHLCETGAPLFLMDQLPVEMYGMRHEAVARELTLLRRFNDSEMYVCPKQQ